jgi:hypothetical protein
MHDHRTKRERTRCWTHCVAADGCDQTAHGNVTIRAICNCGWTRDTESNAGVRRHGPWTLPRWLAA